MKECDNLTESHTHQLPQEKTDYSLFRLIYSIMTSCQGAARTGLIQKQGEPRVTPVQGVLPMMGHSSTGPEYSWQSQGLVTGSIDNLDTLSGAPGPESILDTQSEIRVRARDRAII